MEMMQATKPQIQLGSSKNLGWPTSSTIPKKPMANPIHVSTFGIFCQMSHIRIAITSGIKEIKRAAIPLSIYCRLQTRKPLPIAKNNKPAKSVSLNSFLERLKSPLIKRKRTINEPEMINRIEPSRNGGKAFKAQLFARYVAPQTI